MVPVDQAGEHGDLADEHPGLRLRRQLDDVAEAGLHPHARGVLHRHRHRDRAVGVDRVRCEQMVDDRRHLHGLARRVAGLDPALGARRGRALVAAGARDGLYPVARARGREHALGAAARRDGGTARIEVGAARKRLPDGAAGETRQDEREKQADGRGHESLMDEEVRNERGRQVPRASAGGRHARRPARGAWPPRRPARRRR